MIDMTTRAGRRVAERLGEEIIVWLVTVRPGGQPQPSPVWFLWREPDVLVYSQPTAAKLRNIATNPHVALHFDDGRGADVAIIEGTARVDRALPHADAVPEYVEKYREHIARLGWTPESFAAHYSVPFRIDISRIRAW